MSYDQMNHLNHDQPFALSKNTMYVVCTQLPKMCMPCTVWLQLPYYRKKLAWNPETSPRHYTLRLRVYIHKLEIQILSTQSMFLTIQCTIYISTYISSHQLTNWARLVVPNSSLAHQLCTSSNIDTRNRPWGSTIGQSGPG